MARYKSRLKTDFDPMVEGQRLRDDPERGNVESIRELRNRPDPEGDAFLRGAARDAGFKGDVGFGATKDQSWGVNPRTGASRPEPQGPQAGVEPFTAHGAGRKTGEFIDKTAGAASRFMLTGDPREGERPTLGESYQKHIGRPFEDFARGLVGAGPVQQGSQGVPGVSDAQANTGVPTGDPGAFRGGRGPGYGDVSGFVDDNRPYERARNDPATGNPQGGPEDFMRNAFTGGADETGAGGFGAPGSSGTPGPGGTVSTVSSEAFMSPGGRAAGDAAAAQARRDFQLRREGNQHLASTATPEEKTAARMNEIQRELNNLDLGTNQSFSSLANNKARARRLEQEMAAIQSGQTVAAERDFESREAALDRQAALQEAVINKMLGGGDLKVGSTMETIKSKMVNEGFDSLTPEENFLMTEKIREQAISDLSKENFGEPVTQDQIKERMDLMLGQLKQAASRSSNAADQTASNLAGMGLNDLPSKVRDALKQGKAVKYQGTTYAMGQDDTVRPVPQ